jgi:hypothetical protein
MMSNETEAVIRSLPRKKSPRRTDSLLNCTRPLKKELTPMLLKVFNKIEKEGMLLNSFYKASITLIQKKKKNQDKGTTKRKDQFSS